jgi:hypothetical protein
MPDLEPKTVEGRARRVQRYSPIFFWYVPLMAMIWLGIAMHYLQWDWRLALVVGLPFLAIGVVIGVRFRDVP